MKARLILTFLSVLSCLTLSAQTAGGGLSEEALKEISKGYADTPSDRAIRNALNQTPINTLATVAQHPMSDTHFTYEVKTKGRTDQASSGRCWLFSGLNVLRARMIDAYNLGNFTFSQDYVFFYDQLEKANLFLQGVIDTRDRPMDERMVDWLFKNPISDGGTFTGVADLVSKYGLVPSEVMPETYNADNTSQMRAHLSEKLREDGLRLRESKARDLEPMKIEMLKEIYHILALCLGVPPQSFEWTMYDKDGKAVSTQTYTPRSFCDQFIDKSLISDYVMVMNDPSRAYHKVYDIDYDRHTYDGHDWLYLNLPLEEIKQMALASLKDNTAMYFSCDVAKFLNRKTGVCDLANYNYGDLLGVKFGMDKKERIMTHSSGSSHAMTLIAVDLKDGKPSKWMVENSWGANYGWKGNLIMTDEWFDNYMFRLVVQKKYVPADILAKFNQKPVQLPAWDPMFLPEE